MGKNGKWGEKVHWVNMPHVVKIVHWMKVPHSMKRVHCAKMAYGVKNVHLEKKVHWLKMVHGMNFCKIETKSVRSKQNLYQNVLQNLHITALVYKSLFKCLC